MAHSPKPPMAQQESAGSTSGGVDLCAWAVQYEPALRRYFSRRANAADIDDLVQEVFVMLQARGVESEIENVEGYLFRTAASALSRRHRTPTWAWGRQEEVDDESAPTDEFSPERILIGKEALQAMLTALKEIPRRSAMAFMLFRVERLPQEEVARRMGVSERAVRALVNRAHKQIYERMGRRP